MKNIMVSAAASVALFFGLALPAPEADAKRMGGGGSFGMQRSVAPPAKPATPPRQVQQPQQAAPAAAAAPAQTAGRSWMGPVAGLAAGLGLAALASYLGFGEELASLLLVLLLIGGAFLLYKLLTHRRQPQSAAFRYAGASPHGRVEPMPFDPLGGTGGEKVDAGMTAATGRIPADFDTEGFLRQAKLNFIRLQAANDRGDMDDLKNFLTPEVFAEVQMQYRERGQAAQFTDVVELEADLLELVSEQGRYVASVHFHGLLREEEGAAPTPFAEIWHLVKPQDGSFGWRVAGIQQVS